MKHDKITKALLASAIVGLTAVANPAKADLFAFSKLDVTNFVILGSDGQPLDALTDFNTLSFTSSADMDGTLTGTAGFSESVPNTTGEIDFLSQHLSTTGDANPLLPENTFPFYTGPQGTDVVAADQAQLGSPIANQPGFPAGAGAHVGQAAFGNLSATEAEGSANVNNGLEATWTFSLAQAGGITFAGDVATYVEAFASAGEIFPGKAAAATDFQITITDIDGGGVIVFDTNDIAAFDIFNQTTAANAAGFGFDLQTCGDFAGLFGGCGTELISGFGLTTGPLLADNNYQLAIRSNTNIDIARVEPRVPEPATLGLLGLGLLGVCMRRRRIA